MTRKSQAQEPRADAAPAPSQFDVLVQELSSARAWADSAAEARKAAQAADAQARQDVRRAEDALFAHVDSLVQNAASQDLAAGAATA